ncbi:MAG: hypothetical protein AB7K71_26340, partial [Polyangiaceae bacterium]
MRWRRLGLVIAVLCAGACSSAPPPMAAPPPAAEEPPDTEVEEGTASEAPEAWPWEPSYDQVRACLAQHCGSPDFRPCLEECRQHGDSLVLDGFEGRSRCDGECTRRYEIEECHELCRMDMRAFLKIPEHGLEMGPPGTVECIREANTCSASCGANPRASC